MKTEKELPHSELTSVILGCCFEVMKELGPGLLVNFRNRKLEWKRLQSNEEWLDEEETVEEPSIV